MGSYVSSFIDFDDEEGDANYVTPDADHSAEEAANVCNEAALASDGGIEVETAVQTTNANPITERKLETNDPTQFVQGQQQSAQGTLRAIPEKGLGSEKLAERRELHDQASWVDPEEGLLSFMLNDGSENFAAGGPPGEVVPIIPGQQQSAQGTLLATPEKGLGSDTLAEGKKLHHQASWVNPEEELLSFMLNNGSENCAAGGPSGEVSPIIPGQPLSAQEPLLAIPEKGLGSDTLAKSTNLQDQASLDNPEDNKLTGNYVAGGTSGGNLEASGEEPNPNLEDQSDTTSEQPDLASELHSPTAQHTKSTGVVGETVEENQRPTEANYEPNPGEGVQFMAETNALKANLMAILLENVGAHDKAGNMLRECGEGTSESPLGQLSSEPVLTRCNLLRRSVVPSEAGTGSEEWDLPADHQGGSQALKGAAGCNDCQLLKGALQESTKELRELRSALLLRMGADESDLVGDLKSEVEDQADRIKDLEAALREAKEEARMRTKSAYGTVVDKIELGAKNQQMQETFEWKLQEMHSLVECLRDDLDAERENTQKLQAEVLRLKREVKGLKAANGA